MCFSLHAQILKHATETKQSGTWLGAALKITALTVIKMLSDKRLTVQLSSVCAEGQRELPGRGQWADTELPGGAAIR